MVPAIQPLQAFNLAGPHQAKEKMQPGSIEASFVRLKVSATSLFPPHSAQLFIDAAEQARLQLNMAP